MVCEDPFLDVGAQEKVEVKTANSVGEIIKLKLSFIYVMIYG